MLGGVWLPMWAISRGSLAGCWQHILQSQDGSVSLRVTGCPGAGPGTDQTLLSIQNLTPESPHPVLQQKPATDMAL